MTSELERLFKEMYDLTEPECRTTCRVPQSCCDPMYCEMAENFAKSQNVELTPVNQHPTLKFMSPTGCTVPPHYRPACTLHTCAVNSFGFKPYDPKWTERYFELRHKIEDELWKSLG